MAEYCKLDASTLINAASNAKTASPKVVTEAGIAMDVRFIQSAKAYVFSFVTDDGITNAPLMDVGHSIRVVWLLLYNTPFKLE